MAEKEHCKLSQHGVALLDKIEHLRARSLLAKDTSSPISIGSADCNLNCACSVELEHNYPANTRIRIVRLGKLNTKGLEGSGLLTIVCVVADRTQSHSAKALGLYREILPPRPAVMCSFALGVTRKERRSTFFATRISATIFLLFLLSYLTSWIQAQRSQTVPSAHHWLNGSTPQLGVGCCRRTPLSCSGCIVGHPYTTPRKVAIRRDNMQQIRLLFFNPSLI
jgi:hypothetical protein